MNNLPPEIREKIELLANLPKIRFAFCPGFEKNPEGNSAPGSRLVRMDNSELGLVNFLRSDPIPLRDLLDDFTLALVTDANGYTCVRASDAAGNWRVELAPALPAMYNREDETSHALIRAHFTPPNATSVP
jgi:hypothetical protein